MDNHARGPKGGIEGRGEAVRNPFRLDGRVALVTGGGQGIGRGLAHALGEAGASLAIADRDRGRAEAVAGELRAKSIPAMAIEADVSDPAQVKAMVWRRRWSGSVSSTSPSTMPV